MESARVRGCFVGTPRVAPGAPRQADASRRRNGPRKSTLASMITVRLSRKSCPAPVTRRDRRRERVVVAPSRKAPAGGGGDENQVGRAGSGSWTARADVGARVSLL